MCVHSNADIYGAAECATNAYKDEVRIGYNHRDSLSSLCVSFQVDQRPFQYSVDKLLSLSFFHPILCRFVIPSLI